MRGRSRPGYAPHGLELDDEAYTVGVVERDGSSCVVHSRTTDPDSPATVFLHGAAGSWTTWTPLLRSAEDAAVAIPNPVLLDLPGWGDARLRPGADLLTSAADLVAQALEAAGFTRCVLVGHSMGGLVALELAGSGRFGVEGVVAVSATGPAVVAAVRHPLRGLLRLPGFVLLRALMRVLATLGEHERGPVRGLRAVGLLRWAVAPLFRHPLLVPASVVDALADEVRPRSFSAAARAVRTYDLAAAWARVRCPVQVIQGDRDVFAGPRDVDAARALLPQATTAILADCGHFAHIERPDRVLDALRLSL